MMRVSSAKDPGDMAGKAFNAQAFGSHPYATAPDGTEESVTALTRDDLVAAHEATIARDRIFVAAAGDISADELGKMLDVLFGALPETGAPLPGRAPFNLTGGTTVIEYPGPQSVVLWGEQGVVHQCFDTLNEWRKVAKNVQGHSLPCGHYIAEEAPELLLQCVDFLDV